MRIRLALLAALIAGPALAADEPVATASGAAPPTVAEQIDAYLKTSPVLQADDGQVQGVTARDDRKPHGVVQVGVGTGGYRSIYVRSDMPLGETGRLSVAFEDTRYGRGHGPVYGGGPWRLDGDQRCDLEGMTPPRPLDTLGGPHGRCVGRGP